MILVFNLKIKQWVLLLWMFLLLMSFTNWPISAQSTEYIACANSGYVKCISCVSYQHFYNACHITISLRVYELSKGWRWGETPARRLASRVDCMRERFIICKRETTGPDQLWDDVLTFLRRRQGIFLQSLCQRNQMFLTRHGDIFQTFFGFFFKPKQDLFMCFLCLNVTRP